MAGSRRWRLRPGREREKVGVACTVRLRALGEQFLIESGIVGGERVCWGIPLVFCKGQL